MQVPIFVLTSEDLHRYISLSEFQSQSMEGLTSAFHTIDDGRPTWLLPLERKVSEINLLNSASLKYTGHFRITLYLQIYVIDISPFQHMVHKLTKAKCAKNESRSAKTYF